MSDMPDVFFYEAFEEEAAAIQRLLPARYSAGYTDQTIQESGHLAPPAKLISLRTQSRIPREWAPRIDGLLSRSTGYDHLLAYARSVATSPALGYLPLYCHRAVAEQAILMAMALLRRLPRQRNQFHSFNRDGLTGREIAGKTLVVVGVGHIGAEICQIGHALGMRTLGVDPNHDRPEIEYVTIEAALPQADVLVCAMDLNDSNRGFFSAAYWQLVKQDAIFVNISRGELSPSVELLQALNQGRLAGVALDVYNHESVLATSLRTGQSTDDAEARAALELAQRDDCLCTPHNAFNTVEAVERKSEHSVQQIVAFLDDGTFLWSPPS